MKTITQKANELGISRQAVHQKIQSGKIKAKRVGSFWLIDERTPRTKGVKTTFGREYRQGEPYSEDLR